MRNELNILCQHSMRIAGFQPCSLSDFPGKIAAIVFTQGCPFACGYCHNPGLIPAKAGAYTEEDILERLKQRRMFIDGVVVTGGEPTVQPDLPDFLRKIREIGIEIKLDTNGVHPKMIEALIKEKLVDFFAMDIKHRFDKYEDVVGEVGSAVKELCQKTMDHIISSGVAYEFRTTTDAGIHTLEDIATISAQLPRGARYALQALRREKTYKSNLPQCSMSTDQFLEICKKDTEKNRPDIHLIIRA